MELKRVNQDFYVAGQITANDIAKIAGQGIKLLYVTVQMEKVQINPM